MVMPAMITMIVIMKMTKTMAMIKNQIKGSGPDWYISSTLLYSRDIPFWSRTLEIRFTF